ncbi:MAG: DUF4835 family protein [Bacteroidota bacterium]|nr:DUF4835 family protein [Bacteroidota bacterium]
MFIGLALQQPSFAQVDCQVTINTDKLQGSTKDLLQNFAGDLQNYVNSTKWSPDDLQGYKIKCSIQIFFTSGSADNTYTAQMFLGSSRPVYKGDTPLEKNTAMLRLFDDQWNFSYLRYKPFIHDETRFDDLLSFIDYYMNIVVGYDYDSYKALTGTPYFQRAMSICNKAPSTATGWTKVSTVYNRYGFAEELLSPKYQPFREGMFTYHYNGLDLLATEPDKGLKNIVGFLQSIQNTQNTVNARSLLIKTFFDTKYLELADIFKNYPDRNSVYQLLSTIDPAHQTTYAQAASQ